MSLLTGFEHIARRDEPLAMHTWFQLGGPAEYFAEPETTDELLALLARFHDKGLPVHLLGGGSNVLVRDEGVRGLVLRLTAPSFGKIKVDGDTITVGGGATLGRTVTTASTAGWPAWKLWSASPARSVGPCTATRAPTAAMLDSGPSLRPR